jgi:hypothetical protein
MDIMDAITHIVRRDALLYTVLPYTTIRGSGVAEIVAVAPHMISTSNGCVTGCLPKRLYDVLAEYTLR